MTCRKIQEHQSIEVNQETQKDLRSSEEATKKGNITQSQFADNNFRIEEPQDMVLTDLPEKDCSPIKSKQGSRKHSVQIIDLEEDKISESTTQKNRLQMEGHIFMGPNRDTYHEMNKISEKRAASIFDGMSNFVSRATELAPKLNKEDFNYTIEENKDDIISSGQIQLAFDLNFERDPITSRNYLFKNIQIHRYSDNAHKYLKDALASFSKVDKEKFGLTLKSFRLFRNEVCHPQNIYPNHEVLKSYNLVLKVLSDKPLTLNNLEEIGKDDLDTFAQLLNTKYKKKKPEDQISAHEPTVNTLMKINKCMEDSLVIISNSFKSDCSENLAYYFREFMEFEWFKSGESVIMNPNQQPNLAEKFIGFTLYKKYHYDLVKEKMIKYSYDPFEYLKEKHDNSSLTYQKILNSMGKEIPALSSSRHFDEVSNGTEDSSSFNDNTDIREMNEMKRNLSIFNNVETNFMKVYFGIDR